MWEGLPAISVEGLPAGNVEGLPAISVEGLPAISVEGLPAGNVAGLPAISVEGLPAGNVAGLPASHRRRSGYGAQEAGGLRSPTSWLCVVDPERSRRAICCCGPLALFTILTS